MRELERMQRIRRRKIELERKAFLKKNLRILRQINGRRRLNYYPFHNKLKAKKNIKYYNKNEYRDIKIINLGKNSFGENKWVIYG